MEIFRLGDESEPRKTSKRVGAPELTGGASGKAEGRFGALETGVGAWPGAGAQPGIGALSEAASVRVEGYPVRRITKMSPGVRNENRVNIFLNEKFAFSLDIAQVVDFRLKVGLVLTPEEVEKYRRASEFGKLYQNMLEWVLVRPRSVREARDHLRLKQRKRVLENRRRELARERLKQHPEQRETRKWRDENGFCHEEKKRHVATKQLPELQDEDLEAVLQRLIERGYIDDRRFAEYFVENRFVKKGISQRRLRQELAQKGVSKEIVEEVLAAGGRSESDEIRKMIAKKRRKYDDEKLTAYLCRQGFSYDLVRELVKESSAEETGR